jgi:hypothetical protein
MTRRIALAVSLALVLALAAPSSAFATASLIGTKNQSGIGLTGTAVIAQFSIQGWYYANTTTTWKIDTMQSKATAVHLVLPQYLDYVYAVPRSGTTDIIPAGHVSSNSHLFEIGIANPVVHTWSGVGAVVRRGTGNVKCHIHYRWSDLTRLLAPAEATFATPGMF